MKHITLIAGALLALTVPAAAQWPGDRFDAYPANQQLFNVGGWTGWDNTAAAAGTVDGTRSRSWPNSIRCGPTTDAVHPLIGITSGKWTVTAWQYIPSPQTGDCYFILNNVYNHGGPYAWTAQLRCESTNGMVEDDLRLATDTPQPIVYNTWVEFRIEIDLDANTVTNYYNGAQVSQGVYAATGPRAISNIDLFNDTGTCNWDDIEFGWRGDSFETYVSPTSLFNVGGWTGWDNTAAAAGTANNTRARTGTQSLFAGPTTDAVHPQIGITSGRWSVTAWQYIPSPQTADCYFILNNVYNHGGPYAWTVQLRCESTNGMVEDDLRLATDTPQPIVYDAWVQFRIEIDLDANTITNYYNGAQVSRGVYAATGPRAISNIDLFNDSGTCSWDDVSFGRVTTPPCFETNLGTALALGDDQTVDRPLGFTFPFPGGSTATVGICSNGFVWLAAGQTNADFSPSVAEFLGSVQATPRLAACWRDFDPTAAGSDDVYLNTSIPGRAVITWHKLIRFTGTTPMTVQLQMMADGTYYVFFDANFDTSGGIVLTGVKCAAGVVADPGMTDYTVALPISTTVSTNYEFFAAATTFDMRGRCLRFVPNTTAGYEVSFRFDCDARSASYGLGCPAGTPVTLAASAAPRLGSTFNLNVTNVPIGADAGAILFGAGTANISLSVIGFTGCSVYTTMDLVAGLPLTPPTGTLAINVPLTAALIGVALNTQAAVVKNSAPTATHTSNGLTLVFGKN